ncbi:unnamed protein product [Thlaspi arvense]|uniref:Uncharacterized protein n=1 Tax=Thlaspi arvense TaxID=13288 RepID=A0AAU9RKA3_THLAR|nr:unnamed protein product [Thlaspi arvense]
MLSADESNYERFLRCTSPSVRVHYYNQTSGGASSSSAAAPGGEAREVRKPRIALKDVWSAYEEWSCFGAGVPLLLDNIHTEVTQYYAPTLSAIQIFTIKPFSGDSSSRSSAIGASAMPNYRHPFLPPENLGNLYFQFNETTRPFERDTLTQKIGTLAEQYTGLNTLTSTDLSPYSWLSVSWYPIYPIPSVKSRKDLSASFLTYHTLTPYFKDDEVEEQGMSSTQEGVKVEEEGVSRTPEVVIPPFGAVSYKAFGNTWIMPGTLDHLNTVKYEEAASTMLGTLAFFQNDFNFFMSSKFYGPPR